MLDLTRLDEFTIELLAGAAPDEVLVRAAKLGDRVAFAKLWERHSKTAFHAACRIMKNRADAEDVIQEAWIRAYVHLKSFDGTAKFSTWLTRIAINSALMTLRRKRSRPETPMEITDGETWRHWEIADERSDVEQDYIRGETAQHLRCAIRRLAPNLRVVVEIHQLSDGALKEIADLAGISVAATKSRLFRARTILRSVSKLNGSRPKESRVLIWPGTNSSDPDTIPMPTRTLLDNSASPPT
jgi:RNA polymerase sigma-70 factor (ECF subfamily)